MIKQKKSILIAALCSAALLAAGCHTGKQEDSAKAENGHLGNLDVWPDLQKPKTYDAEVEARVDTLLAQMTLEQKVGQMTQAEITWVTPEDVKKYHLGSVLNGGGSFLHGKRHAPIEEWVAYMDSIYDASMDTSGGGLPIPVTYGIDAVHGNNKFGQATIFPHNIGLGAANNPELLKKIGEITALEVLVTGIDWTFAPTLAVVRDDRWGRTYEGYSEDPAIVAEYGRAMAEGVQGVAGTDSFLDDHHVYATAKHWVGDGGTVDGVDQGDNINSEKDLANIQAAGYFPAIEAGIQSIMTSHSSWHGKRMHGHDYLNNTILKGKLGFDGFIVGDWNAHQKVAGCTRTDCPQAINAGVDMFMVVEDYKEFIATTIEHVNNGVISQERIDDAARRILRVKVRSGLFEKGRPSGRPYAGKAELMGAEAHREVARQAVRESLVLLKNDGNLLPLNAKQNVLVAGDGADNVAKQMGGWTISWQGEENTKEDFTGASTILDGIRTKVKDAGGELQYSVSGEYEQKPDVAIVVFGENPYAEWYGDVQTIAYKPFDDKDAKLLEKLEREGIPVVALFITGRPLWVNREINASDAFVSVWLPGSEGKAVSDVIFKKANGSINHDFKGKLSFSWPKKASQRVLNVGDKKYDPLFPYGFGLTYSDSVELAELDEKNDFELKIDVDAPYPIMMGLVTKPWMTMIIDSKEKEFPGAARAHNYAMNIMEADKSVQGDAKEVAWNGEEKGVFGFGSAWFKTDLLGYVLNQGVVSFDVRTIQDPQGPVKLDMGCPAGYCGDIDLTPLLASAESQEWKTLTIDLMCFAKKGVEFERSSAPFVLTADKPAALRLANIQYIANYEGKRDVTCAE